MANMLEKYQNVSEEAAVPIDESVSKAKKQRTLKKKYIRVLKKLAKAFRKHNELMEQEVARRKAEKEAVEKDTPVCTNGKVVKGFFSKLGDAICKAVPKILTTLATLAFGFFFKTKFAGNVHQIV